MYTMNEDNIYKTHSVCSWKSEAYCVTGLGLMKIIFVWRKR